VTVIAVDGLYLRQPIPYRGFELAPGNRLDLDIAFGTTAVSRTLPVIDRFYPPSPNPLGEIVVDGESVSAPARFASPAAGLVPAWREALALPVTKQFRLNARRGGEYWIEGTINGEAFHHAGAAGGEAGGQAGRQHVHGAAPPALVMRRGAFQHLQFVNESYRLHPIHLHGMFFR